ncbi:MAG: hypothetical protein QXY01_05755 [Candidatus Bathyarchaeia archaeon]
MGDLGLAAAINYYSLFLDILQFLACLWALYYAATKHKSRVYFVSGFLFLLLYAVVDLVDSWVFKAPSGAQALDIVSFILIVLAALSFARGLMDLKR